MKIIKITAQNIQQYLQTLITLNDQFLIDLNISKQRTQQQKEAILRNMIKPNSPTHLLLGLSEQQRAIGMVYFNEGTGYSCGGDYVWINSMFIVAKERSKGHGSTFLKHIEDWATKKEVTLLVSSRGTHNAHSGKMFENMGFEQSENVSITKKLNN